MKWNMLWFHNIIRSYCKICARDNLLWSVANFLLSLNWNTIEACLCYYSKGQLCATCLMSNQFCQYITKVLYYGPNIYYSGLSTSCKKKMIAGGPLPGYYFPTLTIVVCSSSIYGFWLPLWYLQTLLTPICMTNRLYIPDVYLIGVIDFEIGK